MQLFFYIGQVGVWLSGFTLYVRINLSTLNGGYGFIHIKLCKNCCKILTIIFYFEQRKDKNDKFFPHVRKMRKHAQEVENEITKLTQLSMKGESNIAEQKENISGTFFELLNVEQTNTVLGILDIRNKCEILYF